MGALYLKPLDDAMARTGLFYCRFMDDWVILSPTQARFRRAVATVNRVLQDLKVEKHPDKTFIGRISRGFDFLGYQFEKDALGVRVRPGEKTVRRYMARVATMYAEGASAEEVAAYERRWLSWVRGGVRGLLLRFFGVWGICWGQLNRCVAALPRKGWVGCFPELYEHGTWGCWESGWQEDQSSLTPSIWGRMINRVLSPHDNFPL